MQDQLHTKIVLPEKLTCTALDRCGSYFAGGTASGRVYLWEARI
jgi:pre-rRNA-processing protein IPI3